MNERLPPLDQARSQRFRESVGDVLIDNRGQFHGLASLLRDPQIATERGRQETFVKTRLLKPTELVQAFDH